MNTMRSGVEAPTSGQVQDELGRPRSGGSPFLGCQGLGGDDLRSTESFCGSGDGTSRPVVPA